ncbi:MAG: pilus (MSHA type) biogenesis protein MshL [Sulfuricurvum sp.]
MKLVTLTKRALFLSLTAAMVIAAPLNAADCTYQLFKLSTPKGVSIGDFIDEISEECAMSIIVADSEAEKILKKPLNKTHLNQLTIHEVLDLILKENDLQYTLQNNVLKMSYITTKTYSIDYITTKRTGKGNTNIRLSSSSGATTTVAPVAAAGATPAAGAAQTGSDSGTNITTSDEVVFWDRLEQEIRSVLSRPEDGYHNDQYDKVVSTRADTSINTNQAVDKDVRQTTQEVVAADKHNIFINKDAGLVTVTGTGKQIKRLDTYMEQLEKKMQSQVMIDVKMYSVVFTDGSTMGVDWSQIYNLQNISIGFDQALRTNVSGSTFSTAYEGNGVKTLTQTGGTVDPLTGRVIPTYEMATLAGVQSPVTAMSRLLTLSSNFAINDLVKFLKTQGDVYSISNPKIMTLNNQPALISAGNELFYKTIDTTTLAGGTTGTQGTTQNIKSVFAGVLLDITPEISDDGTILLRINPSISDTLSAISSDNSTRSMPPDLSRRQVSSVVSIHDGERVILGGLINRRSTTTSTKLPLLGDLPFVGYLFKQEGTAERVEELVIIIEPHIIKRNGSTVGLTDLGYNRISPIVRKEELRKGVQDRLDANRMPQPALDTTRMPQPALDTNRLMAPPPLQQGQTRRNLE